MRHSRHRDKVERQSRHRHKIDNTLLLALCLSPLSYPTRLTYLQRGHNTLLQTLCLSPLSNPTRYTSLQRGHNTGSSAVRHKNNIHDLRLWPG